MVLSIMPVGTYVKIKYCVSLESGEILKGDPADSLEYMEFITGFNQVLPGLEKRLIGFEQEDEVTITIPAEEAFGPYDPSLVKEKSFLEFPQGKSLEPGKWVLAKNGQYQITCGYCVKEKSAESITLDYNHPLAGKVLRYHVRIIEARAARQEELALVRPCDFQPGGTPTVVSTDLGAS